jgi:hypothetical protein
MNSGFLSGGIIATLPHWLRKYIGVRISVNVYMYSFSNPAPEAEKEAPLSAILFPQCKSW